MRIDASGNLLVGKTASDLGVTAGIELNGQYDVGYFTRSGDKPLVVNRLSSDGSITDFRKDGTTVGSIGTTGGDMYVGTGDCAIRFSDGGDQIRVCTNTGSNRDGAIDLGFTDSRFKDLYLSGGVYLGGTGAANLLEDYEEGTWTPTGTNISAANGTYTKIGNQVTVFGYAYWNGAGEMSIGGLPFTCVKSGEGAVSYKNVDLTAGTIQITGSADVSGTTFTGFNSFDNGARAPNTVTKDTSELWFSVTYSV